MENKKLKLDFEMTIFDVVDLNKSFAAAKCLVCYAGRNKNKSDISKTKLLDALPSMKNIPVVGRYDVEKDDFGSHDLKVITTNDGVDVVNATIPFGVIPESANQWFEIRNVEGEDKECLFTDVVLWKRQHGYQHIAEAGTLSESMEINVSEFIVDQDGYCIVDKFEFEALCLLGSSVTPCFENACVQMYSNEVVSDFKLQFSEMLKEFKELSQNKDSEPNNISNKGGEPLEKLEILKKFNKTVDELDFSIDDMTIEELSIKMEELFGNVEPTAEPKFVADPEPIPEPVVDPSNNTKPTEPAQNDNPEQVPVATVMSNDKSEPKAEPVVFSATYKEKRLALENALDSNVVFDDDGNCIEETTFWVEDFSDEYVFVEKNHWTRDNYECKHGRFAYTFDEKEMTATITGEFEEMVKVWLTLEEKVKLDSERANFESTKTAYEEYKLSHSYEDETVKELLDFKAKTEAAEVFAKYANRIGDTVEFKELKKNVANYSLEQLEKECVYIVGLHAEKLSFEKPVEKKTSFKFSVEPENTIEPEEEPYGGLFEKYLGR